MCCPFRSKLKNYHGNLILKPTTQNVLTETSEVLTLHVRSLSKTRLKQHIGTLSKSEIAKIQKCLNEILNY
jgi:mRNA interferase MazF